MNVRVVKEQKAEKITLESPVMQSSAASGSCRIHFSYSLYKAYPGTVEIIFIISPYSSNK